MTDFELTKPNGELWEFRGISVDAVKRVREALRQDVPDLTADQIKQIVFKFSNNFVNYTRSRPDSIILKDPNTNEQIYTIRRIVGEKLIKDRNRDRRIPFGGLVLKTPAPEPPADNPTEQAEEEVPIQAAQPQQQPRTLGKEVTIQSKDEPQPTRSREIKTIAKEEKPDTQSEDPDFAEGGKKRKARKYTQRKKRNGPSRVFRHRASRMSTRKNKTSRK